jgi:hypothetical protein
MRRASALPAVALIVLAASASLVSGCTTWNGRRSGELQIVRVGIEAKNFRVVKSKIQASASCQYLFPDIGGIFAQGAFSYLKNKLTGGEEALQAANALGGGPIRAVGGGFAMGDPNLYEQCMKKLREQAELDGKACILNNIVQEDTTTSYIVIGDRKLTLTADVVEFLGDYVDYAQRPAGGAAPK